MLTTSITAQNPERYGWNWSGFQGSPRNLAINHRDLQSIDRILSLLPHRRAVVQAGGNLGIFPKRLAQVFSAVYTFEPAPDLFAILQHNAPEPNIVKFQAALGNVRGLSGLSRVRRDGKNHLPSHEGLTHLEGLGIVPTLRIDDLGLPVCDLIYLDVESSEDAALRGAQETLVRCRPALAIEVHAANTRLVGLTVDEFRARIVGYGYRFVTTFLSDDVFLPSEAAA